MSPPGVEIKTELSTEDLLSTHSNQTSSPRNQVACKDSQVLEQRAHNFHSPVAAGLVPKDFQCNECLKFFCTQNSLRLHKRKMHSRPSHTYRCAKCNVSFGTLGSLKKHRKTISHTGESPYKCQTCGISFPKRHSLTKHMKEHHLPKQRYECDICNATFSRAESIRVHKDSKHTAVKPHKCDFCGVRFGQKGNLMSHLRSHTGEKPYQCTECRKAFSHSQSLLNHLRRHTGERPHKCKEMGCGVAFVDSGSLRKHFIAVHSKLTKMYKCEHCQREFKVRSYLVNHIKAIHIGERPFSCDLCHAAFKQKTHLSKHLISVHKDNGASIKSRKNLRCKHCNLVFNRPAKLLFHIKSMHKEDCQGLLPSQLGHKVNSQHFCKECGKDFALSSLLIKHVRIAHSRGNINLHQAIKCEHCSLKFTLAKALHLHTRSKHSTVLRGCSCKVCGSVFSSVEDLKIHNCKRSKMKYRIKESKEMVHEISGIVKKYPVAKEMATEDLLSTHANLASDQRSQVVCNDGQVIEQTAHNFHSPVAAGLVPKDFQCNECLKFFSTQNSLRLHKRKMHSRPSHTYRCVKCNVSFGTLGSLKKHCKTISHTGDSPYKCQTCGISFPRRRSLTKHMKEHHLPKQRYECDICNATFSRTESIRVHKDSKHTAVKPHKCDFCGVRFGQKGNLMSHLRSHTGEKPYQCTECRKAFSQSQSLLNHLRLHTGERPHKCKEMGCAMAFADSGSLRKHFIAVHSKLTKMYKCEHCQREFKVRSYLVNHIKAIHIGERPFSCDLCHATFKQKTHLDKHLKSVHKNNGVSSKLRKDLGCQQCNLVFNGPAELQFHNKSTHQAQSQGLLASQLRPKENGQHSCKLCGKDFARSSLLISHVKVVHSRRNITARQAIKCKHCSLKFTQAKALYLHTRLKHFIPRSGCSCKICGSLFSAAEDLRNHKCERSGMKTRTKESKEMAHEILGLVKKYPAYKEMVSEDRLSAQSYTGMTDRRSSGHNETLLSGQCISEHSMDDLSITIAGAELTAKIQCSDCSEVFASQSALHRHKNTTNFVAAGSRQLQTAMKNHDVTNFYECKKCKATFTVKCAVVSHICQYKCDICDDVFNRKCSMELHKSSIHSVVKPHHCSVCGEHFSKKVNLQCHMHSHTGDKPFICPLADCRKAFSTSRGLLCHHRWHTNNKSYRCKKKSDKRAILQNNDKLASVETLRTPENTLKHSSASPFHQPKILNKSTGNNRKCICLHCKAEFVHASDMRRHITVRHKAIDACETGPENISQSNNEVRHNSYSAVPVNDKTNGELLAGIVQIKCEVLDIECDQSTVEGYTCTETSDAVYQEAVKCEFCRARFNRMDDLASHCEVHRVNKVPSSNNLSENIIECQLPGSLQSPDIDNDFNIGSTSQNELFQCRYCPAEFVQANHLSTHAKETHCIDWDCDTSRSCTMLQESTVFLGNFNVKNCINATGDPGAELVYSVKHGWFQCTHCGAEFVKEDHLSIHIKVNHSELLTSEETDA